MLNNVCEMRIYMYSVPLFRAAPLTLPFSSVAMRLGPVLAGLVHSCVGAAGRFAAVCVVLGGGVF